MICLVSFSELTRANLTDVLRIMEESIANVFLQIRLLLGSYLVRYGNGD